MEKIKMNCIVEMDGDEMTRVLWRMIKAELLEPFVELNTEYYDLSLPTRDETDDSITRMAAEATLRCGVAVKCATITPNAQRMTEYGLKKMWPSPNATIRAILDGTTFRSPIIVENIKPYVRTWKRPITIARHAYGDIYKATEFRVPGPGRAELCFTGDDGERYAATVFDFEGPGVLQGSYNRDDSIEHFARSCFEYALSTGQDLWFSAKDTISKTYDGRFRDIFAELYENEYRESFEAAGLSYFYTLNDDAVARVIRSEGGFIWACKNYDGDIMSDMVSTAFGSLAMMTSVLVSPNGCFEYEAAHGTVTQHYYRYMRGETTSTNPVATIFAWTGALNKRGELDDNAQLCTFAKKLEDACREAIVAGEMTGDLAALCGGTALTSEGFIRAVRTRLEQKL